MKPKYYLYFFLLFTFLQSNRIFSQNNIASSYFPLAIGNKWIYQNKDRRLPYEDSVIVKDTQRVNGKLYWGVLETGYRLSWYRSENNKIYIVDTAAVHFDFSNFREYMLYDFSAADGNTWQVPLKNIYNGCDYGGIIKLEKKNDTVITPQIVFNNCFYFSRVASLCSDAGYVSEWHAKGFGRVAYLTETFRGIDTLLLIYSNLLTGMDNSVNLNIVKGFKLYQNYPNPFNPSTVITFTIPKAQHVTLTIYDILGREITTLLNEYKEAGTYYSQFSILNSKLGSGIYFYCLIVESISIVKKMVLIK